ncbi:MAG: DUF3540 domain-containing protein [Polyangiales bacterium]
MTAVTRTVISAGALPGCARATVLSAAGQTLTLCLAGGDVVEARAVLGLPLDPAPGDAVLCVPADAGEGRTEHFVVAVVASERAVPVPLRAERDDASGRAVVRLPRGGVRFESDGDLELAARAAVRVEGARVEARAREAEVTVARGVVKARRWELVASVAVQAVEALETRAARVVTRAKSVYQEVEDLAQTHAGRVRVVADEALHLHAKRALLKADEDVKVRGEKVHLG